MKRKKGSLKKLTAMPAAASVFALAASAAHAQTPIFDYSFPASWGGTGTTVTDLSGAGNNASYASIDTPALSSAIPTGGTGDSVNTSGGGFDTIATGLLNNNAIAAAGGFTMDVEFMWNGTVTTAHSGYQKLIDYAGTESLQLANTSASGATLEMVFAGDTPPAGSTSPETVAVSTTIQANTWYNVSLNFNTKGNSLTSSDDISGLASLSVNGSLISSAEATKGNYGDGLGRAIGVGEWAANTQFAVYGLNINDFQGDIYNASVTLAPEPSTVALSVLGGLGVLGMRWRARRSKA